MILPREPLSRKSEIIQQRAMIAAQLKAGRHLRCPNCLEWFSRRTMGGVAVFIPHSGAPVIGYGVCEKCAPHVTEPEVMARVESYLTGGK